MTLHLIKADPGTDLYLVWDARTGTPLVVGPREEITTYRHPEHRTITCPAAISRADMHGSGDGPTGVGNWQVPGLWVGADLLGSERWIARGHLTYFAMAVTLNRRDLVEGVTVPYDPARRYLTYLADGPAIGEIYALYYGLDTEQGRAAWRNRTAEPAPHVEEEEPPADGYDETTAPIGIPAHLARREVEEKPAPYGTLTAAPGTGDGPMFVGMSGVDHRPFIGKRLPDALRCLGVTDPWTCSPGLYALLVFACELGEMLPPEDYAPMLDLVVPFHLAWDDQPPLLDEVAKAVRLWLSGPVLMDVLSAEVERVALSMRRIARLEAQLDEPGTFSERKGVRDELIRAIVYAVSYVTPKTAPAAFDLLRKFLLGR